ncbi:30S ribosomal protein S12 methylthiotransferase RimO [Desulfovibrionales bacterium]
MPSIHVISLGCPKNQVDTEEMLGQLGPAFCLAPEPDQADIVLINTCGFIEPAVSESIQTIVDTADSIGTITPKPILVVTGCLVNRYEQELRQELPEVDLFLRIDQQRDLATHLGRAGHSPSRRLTTVPSYAYLKLAEGCNNQCRFCTIPSIRGPLTSRSEADILRDAQECLAQGRKELVLVAQDLTSYGRDRGQTQGLRQVLTKLAALPDLHWLRMMYLYPSGLDRDFLAFLADMPPTVLPYFDIPLQHAHPKILASMGRPFQRDPRTVVDQVRSFFPHAALRTTCIVGYPGETDAHFEALETFVRETRFLHLGVFPYYAEEGSAAASLPHQVPEHIKHERKDRLMAMQAEISADLLADWEGQEIDVLVDRPHAEWPGLYEGRAWFQAPEVDGMTYVSGEGVLPGRLVRAVVEESKTYDLVALA